VLGLGLAEVASSGLVAVASGERVASAAVGAAIEIILGEVSGGVKSVGEGSRSKEVDYS
jgi:hypothetical protein